MNLFVGEQKKNNITFSKKEKSMINKSYNHDEEGNHCHL